VPRVPRGEPFAFEDMAQVAPATGALDLHALAIRVGESSDGPRYLLVEGRPTAVGFELVVREVERRTAPPALVRSGPEEPIVFPRKRWFGPLVDDHPLLRSSKGTECGGTSVGHGPSNGEPY